MTIYLKVSKVTRIACLCSCFPSKITFVKSLNHLATFYGVLVHRTTEEIVHHTELAVPINLFSYFILV